MHWLGDTPAIFLTETVASHLRGSTSEQGLVICESPAGFSHLRGIVKRQGKTVTPVYDTDNPINLYQMLPKPCAPTGLLCAHQSHKVLTIFEVSQAARDDQVRKAVATLQRINKKVQYVRFLGMLENAELVFDLKGKQCSSRDDKFLSRIVALGGYPDSSVYGEIHTLWRNSTSKLLVPRSHVVPKLPDRDHFDPQLGEIGDSRHFVLVLAKVSQPENEGDHPLISAFETPPTNNLGLSLALSCKGVVAGEYDYFALYQIVEPAEMPEKQTCRSLSSAFGRIGGDPVKERSRVFFIKTMPPVPDKTEGQS
jgi:hypothetical protein